MDSGGPTATIPTPADFAGLRLEALRSALDIYLAVAYPDTPVPDAVRRRLEWPPGVDAADLLNRPPFERAARPRDVGPPIRALRLGNRRYPHMKLQIQPWPNAAGFMLSVNTHDQAQAIDPGSPDAAAFRALQDENQRVKEAIEQAWDDAGLPTFLRYLRDYIESQPTCVSPDTGPPPAPVATPEPDKVGG